MSIYLSIYLDTTIYWTKRLLKAPLPLGGPNTKAWTGLFWVWPINLTIIMCPNCVIISDLIIRDFILFHYYIVLIWY